jgi:hypothetical protein
MRNNQAIAVASALEARGLGDEAEIGMEDMPRRHGAAVGVLNKSGLVAFANALSFGFGFSFGVGFSERKQSSGRDPIGGETQTLHKKAEHEQRRPEIECFPASRNHPPSAA